MFETIPSSGAAGPRCRVWETPDGGPGETGLQSTHGCSDPARGRAR